MKSRDLTVEEKTKAFAKFGADVTLVRAHQSGLYVQGENGRSQHSYSSVDDISDTTMKRVKGK